MAMILENILTIQSPNREIMLHSDHTNTPYKVQKKWIQEQLQPYSNQNFNGLNSPSGPAARPESSQNRLNPTW